jgi:diadenosine tetraphosphate (Ap4A) HIT family hydrolase
MSNPNCLFCQYSDPQKNTIISETDLAYSRWDNYPASNGHAEIIPKRHIESYFDLTEAELLSIYSLAKATKLVIDERYNPDGYNIGINDGEAAGRSVHHLHIHLIPRYIGDVPNPCGGIRHIIPGKGDY